MISPKQNHKGNQIHCDLSPEGESVSKKGRVTHFSLIKTILTPEDAPETGKKRVKVITFIKKQSQFHKTNTVYHLPRSRANFIR